MSFLQDVFSTLLDQRRVFLSEKDKRNMQDLCGALMSGQGEVSGTIIAATILTKYEGLSTDEKADFFTFLSSNYDLDPAQVIDAATAYSETRSREKLAELIAVSEPKRQELLRRLNQVAGGTEKLVHMREDLFPLIKDNPEFSVLDYDFEHVFSTWFNRGFLLLKPIDWRTPANILEKIIEYEAVHAINDWDDLRRRLEPSDRRCFAFFHPVMPEEPLIFVEVALTKGVPKSIEDLLTDDREILPETEANTAVFYSISNCQAGLKGVSFGNFLIKQVAGDLAGELRGIKNFVTLSPIPGFVRWLGGQASEGREDIDALNIDALVKADAIEFSDELDATQKPLLKLMAEYMLQAKRRDGYPVDPVARFHLGNGASLDRINWAADKSKNGLLQSAGMMVNYRYKLESVEANHEAYVNEKKVHASKDVKALS